MKLNQKRTVEEVTRIHSLRVNAQVQYFFQKNLLVGNLLWFPFRIQNMMNQDEIKLLLNNNPEAVCDLVIALQANVVALQSKIDVLEERFATLTTRLNKDSRNSSKPSSTDLPG